MRYMRQETRIRPQRSLVKEKDQSALESEHPTGARGRIRYPEAAERLRLLHQGWQSLPLTSGALTSSGRNPSGLNHNGDDHGSPAVSIAYPLPKLPPNHLLQPVRVVNTLLQRGL
jgi:hypothetical protein